MTTVWGRVLRVVFSSRLRKERIEYSTEDETRSLAIEIEGKKYLSALRDEFLISIYNLPYSEILKLIKHEFNEVEIYAGYKTTSVTRIFKGSVFYISNERDSRETNTAHFICVSNLLNLYRGKMNLSLNSGINMYSAINYVLRNAGVVNSNVSEEFKRHVLRDVTEFKGTASTIIDLLSNENRNIVGQVDSSGGSDITLWNLNLTDRRRVVIDSSKGMIINGFPKITSEGVNFESLPVFNYMPGDMLLIDNHLIDISILSLSEAQRLNVGIQLNHSDTSTKGEYLLYHIRYSLTNTDGSFKVKLYAKSKTLYSNIIGSGG